MPWIKRNLFFLIGGVVAVLLLGLAGFYCFSKWQLNNRNLADLDKAYEELKRINALNPNPGNENVDNIAIARDQQIQLLETNKAVRKFFLPIPSIPDSTSISSENFAAALRRTVDELVRAAAAANVTLPPKYDFSFAAQRPLVKFPPGSLEPMAVQLGEVKAICDVLFSARINALYNLRRERISDDDLKGSQADYLDAKSVTNELAVLTPYEVTFYCFSQELSGVLAGFANARHGFVVRTVGVEPGTPGSAAAASDLSATAAMYGVGSGGGGSPPPPAAAPVPVGKGGLPVVLDERQLKVTLTLDIVKLLPNK